MLFNILSSSPNLATGLLIFVILAVALVIALSVHEFAHAFVAQKLGDPTAKSLGRVTLDPRAHLDPTGTLMLLFFGFGWGKPVPFNPNYLKNPKRDSAIIALAGPVSNILMALGAAGLYHVLGLSGGMIGIFVELFASYNLVLAIFNLIPVHPLDGFKVVNGFLPEELSYQWIQMAPYGIFILLFLIISDTTTKIIHPTLSLAMNFLGF